MSFNFVGVKDMDNFDVQKGAPFFDCDELLKLNKNRILAWHFYDMSISETFVFSF